MVQNGDLFPKCVSDPLGGNVQRLITPPLSPDSPCCGGTLHSTKKRPLLFYFTFMRAFLMPSFYSPPTLYHASPHILFQVLALTWSRLNFSRQGFGRGGNNKNNNNNNNNAPPKSPAPLPVAQASPISPAPNSPSLGSPLPMDSPAAYDPDAPKYFFQEKYAPLNVRGNFLTLCACPKNVELGEWLAHQSKQRSLRGMAGVYLPETDTI